jgi:hypothetical protein
MFANTIGAAGDKFALPDYLTQTMQEATTTGFPAMGDVRESAVYKAAQPAFLQNLQENVLPGISERFGMSGGLRSSDYAREAARQGGKSEIDFLSTILPQIIAQDEAAKSRRMQSIPLGFQGAMLPYQMAQEATKGASMMDEARYPNLAEMIQYALGGAGQISRGSESGGALGALSNLFRFSFNPIKIPGLTT